MPESESQILTPHQKHNKQKNPVLASPNTPQAIKHPPDKSALQVPRLFRVPNSPKLFRSESRQGRSRWNQSNENGAMACLYVTRILGVEVVSVAVVDSPVIGAAVLIAVGGVLLAPWDGVESTGSSVRSAVLGKKICIEEVLCAVSQRTILVHERECIRKHRICRLRRDGDDRRR